MNQQDLYLYDSHAGQKRKFIPVRAGHVSIYACGMTVYDYCHIGHARGMVIFDVVSRYLRDCGYVVNYVRNITDIDDKIIARAVENSEQCDALTERFINLMHEDEFSLNILSPDYEPRATEYIEQMIDLIAQLIAQGHAYQGASGDVYFAVKSIPNYGSLSKRDVDEMRSGARVEIASDKKDPMDFVLWKMAKVDEPQWDSPWGAGRPGWHSECVVMSSAILGSPFDIHGGGMDLKFPHHENEIAQACCIANGDFANYWLHVGLLGVNDEKMSKSLNNFLTIRDALQQYSAEVLRYFFVSAHYRSPLNFTHDTMQQVANSLSRLYSSMRDLEKIDAEPYNVNEYLHAFHDAMHDDFNTPLALASLFEFSKIINKLKLENKLGQAKFVADVLCRCAASLGILQLKPEEYLQQTPVDTAEVEKLILARDVARAEKNWQLADELRDRLAAMGLELEDKAGKTTWRKL
jgi:cysteinyl-tRNA synthetase